MENINRYMDIASEIYIESKGFTQEVLNALKQRIKPFTLFLCIIILMFIVLGPKLLSRGLKRPSIHEELLPEEPKWSGIIKIWHVDYVRCGRGSVESWLKPAIDKLESRYLDVFFDIRCITPERLDMYFKGESDRDMLPDIVSLGIYDNAVPVEMLEDIGRYIPKQEREKIIEPAMAEVTVDGDMIGMPYMTGWYAFMLNTNMQGEDIYQIQNQIDELGWEGVDRLVQNASEKHYGFVSYNEPYSRPIDCVGSSKIHSWLDKEVLPEEIEDMTYSKCWDLFVLKEEVGVFLGPTRAIYDMKARRESGKGFDIEVLPIPSFETPQLDQIGIYGILKQDNRHKKLICIEFLLELINDEMQNQLEKIGMFSVREDIQDIYEDIHMKRLEDQLNRLYKCEK